MKDNGLFDQLLKQTWNFSSEKASVVPLAWTEAKIQKMRKFAMETNKSLLQPEWSSMVQLMNLTRPKREKAEELRQKEFKE